MLLTACIMPAKFSTINESILTRYYELKAITFHVYLVCVCVYVRGGVVYVHTRVSVYVEARDWCPVSSSVSPCLVLWGRLFHWAWSHQMTRLLGRWAPGIPHLSLPLRYRLTQLQSCSAFSWEIWRSKLSAMIASSDPLYSFFLLLSYSYALFCIYLVVIFY